MHNFAWLQLFYFLHKMLFSDRGSGLWCIGDTFSQLSLVMAQKHLLLLISHNCSLFPVQISFHSITQCCVRCYKKSEFSDLNQKNHLMIILSSFPHPFCWQHWDIYHNADDVSIFPSTLTTNPSHKRHRSISPNISQHFLQNSCKKNIEPAVPFCGDPGPAQPMRSQECPNGRFYWRRTEITLTDSQPHVENSNSCAMWPWS